MKTITCKCGCQIAKDYGMSFKSGDCYYWRCSDCGQEFIETVKPIIKIDENQGNDK
jgi:hypothetical protein